jgi:hypothetical protein
VRFAGVLTVCSCMLQLVALDAARDFAEAQRWMAHTARIVALANIGGAQLWCVVCACAHLCDAWWRVQVIRRQHADGVAQALDGPGGGGVATGAFAA